MTPGIIPGMVWHDFENEVFDAKTTVNKVRERLLYYIDRLFIIKEKDTEDIDCYCQFTINYNNSCIILQPLNLCTAIILYKAEIIDKNLELYEDDTAVYTCVDGKLISTLKPKINYIVMNFTFSKTKE